MGMSRFIAKERIAPSIEGERQMFAVQTAKTFTVTA
jgi:hypothetical protein